MTWPRLFLGFFAGMLTATAVLLALDAGRHPVHTVPAAGILHGWTVVRDDETLICESPAIFVAAKQIECP